MTVGELKKVLVQYPDYDVCLFDDYADEYGDHDGNIKINFDDDAAASQYVDGISRAILALRCEGEKEMSSTIADIQIFN